MSVDTETVTGTLAILAAATAAIASTCVWFNEPWEQNDDQYPAHVFLPPLEDVYAETSGGTLSDMRRQVTCMLVQKIPKGTARQQAQNELETIYQELREELRMTEYDGHRYTFRPIRFEGPIYYNDSQYDLVANRIVWETRDVF